MRGVGPVPVMSPMSKSFRKRERPRSGAAPKNTPAASAAADAAPPPGAPNPKKPKIESPPGNVEAKKPAAAPPAVKSSALSGASSSSSSHRNVSSPPSTPDPAGTRALRPRPSASSEAVARKSRRPFCDVALTEDDARRVVGRRIKVWWPLDERWYTGDIRNYDGEKRRHWVVYDDHDEEWLRLEKETFKIQLLLGDRFRKAPPNTTSSYLLHGASPDRAAEPEVKPAQVPAPQEENSSSIFGESSSPSLAKPVCVFVRRRKKSTSHITEAVEVQSPMTIAEALPPPETSPASEGVMEALCGPVQPSEASSSSSSSSPSCSPSPSSSGASPEVGFRIERWPLSRNVMELMRFIEIRSGGRRGGASRLLKHVWRGTLPVCYIGDLFGLKFGSSTVVHALSETTPGFMSSDSSASPVCMLISWNGFTIEKNARLKEVLSLGLEQKQVLWRDSFSTGSSGAKTCRDLSVTLLCDGDGGGAVGGAPVFLSSDSCARLPEAPVREACSNTRPFVNKLSPLPSSNLLEASFGGILPLGFTGLRGLLKALGGAAGLRLPATFAQSWTLLSPGFIPLLLAAYRLSRGAAAAPAVASVSAERSTPSPPEPPSSRLPGAGPSTSGGGGALTPSPTTSSPRLLGVKDLLSMSRKGRRTLKGMKRSGSDDALPMAKRVRIMLPEPAPVIIKAEQASPGDLSSAKKARKSPGRRGGGAPSAWSEAFVDEDVFDSLLEAEEEEMMTGDEEAYSLEIEGDDSGGGKRKRRRVADAGGEVRSDSSPAGRKQQDFSPCTANLLIVQADRGWRESGVTVELQRSGGSSTSLVVSLNGDVLYSYKARSYHTQPGTSNRFTHAMMWRGGHDWTLEFSDRLQWRAFRRMHDACVMAQFVRQLPVPAFSEVPGYGDELPSSSSASASSSSSRLPFYRPREYIRQVSQEVDAALLSSGLYDMDGEDDVWLREFNVSKGGGLLSEDVFERVVHQLECSAYIRQEFSDGAAVELCAGLASEEDIRAIHSHWLLRRQKKGMALIRCFQPAPYDRYSALLQAWQAESVRKPGLEQPARFAFCLRPNEAPKKMQRQRPQRKAAIARHWNVEDLYADQELEDSYGHKQDSYSADPGSPGSDDGSYVSKQRSNRGRRPYRKSRKTKAMAAGGWGGDDNHHASSRRSRATFIAPATAMSLDAATSAVTVDVVVDQFEGESCSSMDFDVNEDAVRKAQQARKAARLAAAKAARAQELYAHADAAMKRAVACLIEAEALAAAESAAREMMMQQLEQEDCGEACEIDPLHIDDHHEQQQQQQKQGGDGEEEDDDDDLLLPICNWTHEFGSGLLHKGDDVSPGGVAAGSSPRRGVKYVNLASSQLFKGMVS